MNRMIEAVEGASQPIGMKLRSNRKRRFEYPIKNEFDDISEDDEDKLETLMPARMDDSLFGSQSGLVTTLLPADLKADIKTEMEIEKSSENPKIKNSKNEKQKSKPKNPQQKKYYTPHRRETYKNKIVATLMARRSMIGGAIKSIFSQNGCLNLQDLYEQMERDYPDICNKENEGKWKNSIRHNLSLHKSQFRRVSTHQGGVWCVVIDGDTPEERLSISSTIDYSITKSARGRPRKGEVKEERYKRKKDRHRKPLVQIKLDENLYDQHKDGKRTLILCTKKLANAASAYYQKINQPLAIYTLSSAEIQRCED